MRPANAFKVFDRIYGIRVMPDQTPSPPGPVQPPKNWQHYELFTAVKEAIFSLPTRFESSLNISGVLATDLFAFNSSLGATIEEQVVASLNRLRPVWDPHQTYALYDFERRPQTFPDVVLKARSPDITPGIALSAWQRFLSLFTESSSAQEIDRALDRLATLISCGIAGDGNKAELLKLKFLEIASLIGEESGVR